MFLLLMISHLLIVPLVYIFITAISSGGRSSVYPPTPTHPPTHIPFGKFAGFVAPSFLGSQQSDQVWGHNAQKRPTHNSILNPDAQTKPPPRMFEFRFILCLTL